MPQSAWLCTRKAHDATHGYTGAGVAVVRAQAGACWVCACVAAGMAVELASPLAPPGLFLPMACLGSVARAVTGVAGGATRVALTQHFALEGNAADVSAKEQSQETATTLVGECWCCGRLGRGGGAVMWPRA